MAGETNNLDRSIMTDTQLSKYQTSNDADGQVDAAITASKTVLVDDTNAASIAATDFRRGVEFVLTDGSPVPTAAITITIPAVVRGLLVVRNTTSFTATIGISGQPVTAPTLATLEHAIFHCDGTNVRVVSGSGVSEFIDLSDAPSSYSGEAGQMLRVNSGETAIEFEDAPYDPTFYMPGSPTSSMIVYFLEAIRAFGFPAGMTGSRCRALSAATAQTDFDVQKNGVSIGTIRFAAAGTLATYVSFSASSFAVGDTLKIIAPATPDATLGSVSFGLMGRRA